MNQKIQSLSSKSSVLGGDFVFVGASSYVASTISDATQADPVVITSSSHSLSTGDQVYIDGVEGMTEINGRTFTITVIDSDEFSLDDEDGTGHGSYTSGGKAIRGRLQKSTVTELRNGMGLGTTAMPTFLSIRTSYGSVASLPGGATGFNTYYDGGAWRNIDSSQQGMTMRADAASFQFYQSSTGVNPTLTHFGTLASSLTWNGAGSFAGLTVSSGSLRLGNAAVAETPTATHTLIIKDSSGTDYRILAVPV